MKIAKITAEQKQQQQQNNNNKQIFFALSFALITPQINNSNRYIITWMLRQIFMYSNIVIFLAG